MAQDHSIFFLVPFGFALLAVVMRLVAGSMDEDRVRDYVAARGGRLLSSQWAPFGTGWAGSRNERFYEVRYLDGDGREHAATCKTSLFGGVYFTEDRVVAAPAPPLPMPSRPQPRVESLPRRD